ncbi:unnamed protein product [Phaedon cochleariae]|uniref:Uncharacterized protein n=1 Tax=Phaedon cochleariae TaxID=80249 RepID=A0A9N9SB44_PHACE|nr:unnamed protein product [Phaedon cochleariae]
MRIEDGLRNEIKEEEVEEVIDLSWPEDAFERCRRSIETELIGEERSVIIITKEGEKDTDNFIKKATERNLQISRIVEQEKLEAGKMVGTKTVSEMMAEKGGFEEALIRYTYIISTNGAKAGTDRISLRDNLRKIAEITKTCGHSEIACVVTKQVDGTSTRKCLEWVGREQDVNWVLYKGVDQKTEWEGARKRREEDVIILKPADGTSYAQLVKSMKDTVDTEGITIDKINKTNNGNVQIKIKGKEEKSRSLFRATLTEKLEGVAKIHFKQKTQTFMILDIDETVEEEEVRRVLSKETNSGHSEGMRIKLSEKINDRGLKYAFITLGEDSAKLIENRRRIGNGWNRWRIKKVDEVKKCYRCQKRIIKMEQILESNKHLEQRLGKIEDLIEANKTLKHEVCEIKKSMESQEHLQVDGEAFYREIQDRADRARNIILYNVQESQAQEYSERIKFDEEQCQNVLDHLNVQGGEFKAHRLGHPNNKPRPLKISFSDNNIALNCLKNKRKLVAEETPIRLSADQTPTQREYFKKVKEEFNTRIGKGERNIEIRSYKGTPVIGYRLLCQLKVDHLMIFEGYFDLDISTGCIWFDSNVCPYA